MAMTFEGKIVNYESSSSSTNHEFCLTNSQRSGNEQLSKDENDDKEVTKSESIYSIPPSEFMESNNFEEYFQFDDGPDEEAIEKKKKLLNLNLTQLQIQVEECIKYNDDYKLTDLGSGE